MNIDRTWLMGGAGLVVGGLIGFAIAGDGRAAREAALDRQEALTASVATVSESVSGINAALDDIGARVAGLETSLKEGTERQIGGVEGLAQRLEAVSSEIGGAVTGLGASVTATLGERMEGLRAAVGEIGSRATGGAEPEGGAAAAPAAASGEGLAVGIGQMVVFADGAARVFLSGVDREAGTARIAVNGPQPTSVALGEPTAIGDCSITLTGFTEDGGATFSGDCDGAGAAEAASTGADVPAEGAGTAIVIGTSATLAEGKLRVFLSGVDADAGTARVAVNGPQTIALALAEPTEAGGCTLTLTGIGEGQATVDAGC
jgi:hypothetical protein